MLSECANRIADYLSNNEIVKPEDKEIYIYGLEVILSTAANLLIVTLLGCALGLFVQTVVFVIAFAVLRVYAGGYHAKTHRSCIVTFTAIYLVNMILQRVTPDGIQRVLGSIIALTALVLIFTLAPIEHKNRPFEGNEYCKFKKMSRIIASFEVFLVIAGVVVFPIYHTITYCISLALLSVVLILAIAKKIEV